MGEAKPFEAEKLVVAVLISKANLSRAGYWPRVRDRLEEIFGAIDYTSAELPFAFTHYYDRELGAPLFRLFVAFRELVDPQALPRIKIATNTLEDELRACRTTNPPAAPAGPDRSGLRMPRSVNLDPGLMSLSRFVLASTKDGSHRVPLADGIFGELTLQYQRPCFRPLPWTYPDYRSEKVQEVLLEIRGLLKAQRRDRRSGGGPGSETGPPAASAPRLR